MGVGLAEEVDRWHVANGWLGIGYNFIIDKAGTIVTGRPLEITPAAQLGEIPLVAPDMVRMGNVATIAICTHGSKRWTEAGLLATMDLCQAIDVAYRRNGAVTFHGHKEIDPRPCPVYPYKALLGLDARGVYGGVAPIELSKALAIANRNMPAAWPHLPMVDPPPPDTGLLVEGCQGDAVKRLQAALGMPAAQIDGWFGQQTLQAVWVYQTAHRLKPDGVVGPLTRAALKI